MSDIEEASKAVSEVAKLGQQAISTSEKVGNFLAKVFGSPLDEAAGILGDRIKFMRWERRVRLMERVEQILIEKKTSAVMPIPPKFAIPLIENASMEESDAMQDLWANLMANCLDPAKSQNMQYAYIDILKNLSPIDALILRKCYESALKGEEEENVNLGVFGFRKDDICKLTPISEELYTIAIYNLFRLQCMTPSVKKSRMKFLGQHFDESQGIEVVSVTPLGREIIERCIKSK